MTKKDQPTNEMEPASSPDSGIRDLIRQLGATAVFGAAVQNGDLTVIPVAEARVGFGVRGRRKSDPGLESSGAERAIGGGGVIVPKGFIVVSKDNAYFDPIIDLPRLILSGIALTGLATLLVARLLKK